MIEDDMPSTQNPEGHRWKKGQSGNPGGITSEERKARDAIRLWITTDMLEKGKAAYARLLEADNPVIAKDFMDRIAGKVKEHVALEDPDGNPLSALSGATLAQLLEILSKLKR